MRWALPLTRSPLVDTPLDSSMSISVMRTPRVDDHAVADDRRDMGIEDAAGHELEGEGFTVHNDPMPGVVAALVADDHGHLAGHEVRELALALIAPLRPDDDGRWHGTSPGSGPLRAEPIVSTQWPRSAFPLATVIPGQSRPPDPERFRRSIHDFPASCGKPRYTSGGTVPAVDPDGLPSGFGGPAQSRELLRNSRSTGFRQRDRRPL